MHPLIRRRSGRKVSSPRRWRGVNVHSHPRFLRARPASFLVYFAVHDAFPAKRRVGFPPLVPTRSHDHRLRFTVPAHWPDFNSADLPFGRGAHARFGRCAPLLDSACSLMACNLGLCCVHSFGSRADRSPPEGASCATMSSHTCYRTSRSFHFPFWAVCSLSGTQPEFSRSVAPGPDLARAHSGRSGPRPPVILATEERVCTCTAARLSGLTERPRP